VIAAVVIGGASLAGGEGTILGAVIGAAIMAVIRNAFVLLKLPIYLQTIAIGVVIIIAVALDRLKEKSIVSDRRQKLKGGLIDHSRVILSIRR
jgi:ribose transport system permease protein